MDTSIIWIIVILSVILVAFLSYYLSKKIWAKLHENETLKYEFITIIAHKFRTPLTQVKWMVDTMIPDETDSYKLESLKAMRKSNEQLIQLTGTLIELTDSDSNMKSSYTFDRVNLCEMVRNILETMKTQFKEKNLFFSFKCPVEEVFVAVDVTRMEFVIQTILSNACVYSPPGRNVDIAVYKEKRQAQVSVTDHGIGIAPENLPHIFTKFFRAGNARSFDTEGFGVGLYLAQSVTRRHGGRIFANSAGEGAGSTFMVVLPVTK